ncbi:hypothetical protein BN2475_940011 [Paraburkholderia ribeironis]|uniref:Uncharacterized protein n=1 Tax=Paraburkholderia ribeironis TaxID=1247936 RepID=A0A1N7SL47_9BURK|nr:hypothetical protein BN2475_940011 [Paraburkholderia ribeironis]
MDGMGGVVHVRRTPSSKAQLCAPVQHLHRRSAGGKVRPGHCARLGSARARSARIRRVGEAGDGYVQDDGRILHGGTAWQIDNIIHHRTDPMAERGSVFDLIKWIVARRDLDGTATLQ